MGLINANNNSVLLPDWISKDFFDPEVTRLPLEDYWDPSELQKVLTFRVANLPDQRRVALQTFRIAIGLLSYFKTFRVALLPRYPGVCDSGSRPQKLGP